jgi:hypothetical protein
VPSSIHTWPSRTYQRAHQALVKPKLAIWSSAPVPETVAIGQIAGIMLRNQAR